MRGLCGRLQVTSGLRQAPLTSCFIYRVLVGALEVPGSAGFCWSCVHIKTHLLVYVWLSIYRSPCQLPSKVEEIGLSCQVSSSKI